MSASYGEVVKACSEFQENFSILNARYNLLVEELKQEKEAHERSKAKLNEFQRSEESKDKTIAHLQEELNYALTFKQKHLEVNLQLEEMKVKMENANRLAGDTTTEHELHVRQLLEQLEDLSKRLSCATNSERAHELQKQVQEMEERCAAANAELSEEREKSAQQLLCAHTALQHQQSRNLELEQRTKNMEFELNEMRSTLRRSATLQNEAAILKERLSSETTAAQENANDLRRELDETRARHEQAKKEHESSLQVLRHSFEEEKRMLTDRIATLSAREKKYISELSSERDKYTTLQLTTESRVSAAREEGVSELVVLRKGMNVLKEDLQREKFETERLKEELESRQKLLEDEQHRNASLLQQDQQRQIQLDTAMQQEAWALSEKRHAEERLAFLQRHVDELNEATKEAETISVDVQRLELQNRYSAEEILGLRRSMQQLETKLHHTEDAATEKIQLLKKSARLLRKELETQTSVADSLRRKLLRVLVEKDQDAQFTAARHSAVAASSVDPAAALPTLRSCVAPGGCGDVLDLLHRQNENAEKLLHRISAL